MLLKKKNQTCCSGPACCGENATSSGQTRAQDGMRSGSCCDPQTDTQAGSPASRKLTIDFLYLDLEVCTRCQGTDDTLDQAVAEVAQILQATGVSVVVNKVNVNSEALAIQYRFVSSPTIRIDGRDIALEVKENQCESCGDLCGDTVDCRLWTWQGADYTQPPKAMIMDAILRAVYGQPQGTAAQYAEPAQQSEPFVLPDNLKHFYAAMYRKDGTGYSGQRDDA